MHELYLAESILNIVQDYARRNSFKKVNSKFRFPIGRFSCIEPKALRFAFEVQAKEQRRKTRHWNLKYCPPVSIAFPAKKI